jgi:hypothetical protein
MSTDDDIELTMRDNKVIVLPPAPPPAADIGPTIDTGDEAAQRRIVRQIPDSVSERILVRFGDRVLVTDGRPAVTEGLRGRATVPRAVVETLTATERFGVEALRLRRSTAWAAAKASRPRQGEPWDMVSCDGTPAATMPGQLADSPAIEDHLDVVPTPSGAPPAEGLNDFLEGPIGLAIVIVNGPTAALTFSAVERTKVGAEVQEGLAYLASVNPSAHVSFSTELHVVNLTVPDAAELFEDTWRDAAMAALGYPADWTSVAALAEDVRDRTLSRWGYVLFMTKYSLWHFAYASDDRIVMQYDNDGWGVDNLDRVFAHETGHIFGAPDEYVASFCTTAGSYGRFGEPNRNCAIGNPGSVACLMKENDWALCESTERHLGWGLDQFRAASPAGRISVVSMKPDSLTTVGADHLGDVRFASFDGGPSWWQGWTYLLRGRTAPGGSITAVSRRPGYLDVFMVGLDGRVYTAAYDPSNRWKGWWAIGTLRAPVGAYVGCVSRRLDRLDVFVTDNAGRVMTAAWEPAFIDGWHGWWQLRTGRAAPGAPVSAVSRATDKLDVFVIGTNGGVYAAVQPRSTDGWQDWRRVGNAIAPSRALVSCTSRSRDKLDIFVTDSVGRTLTASWEPAFTDGWHGWWHIRGGWAQAGSPIHAVSRSIDKLDIFVAGVDGGTYTAQWQPSFIDGWHGWFWLRGGATGLGGTITCVSRGMDKLDVVTVGANRRPYTASWEPTFTDGWHGWSPMGS